MILYKALNRISSLIVLFALVACSGSASNKGKKDAAVSISNDGYVVENTSDSAVVSALPYSGEDIYEHVVLDYGNRAIRTDVDVSISMPHMVKDKKKCFILMSKKDYYLYVYEPQGKDTVLVARYDCAFALKKGNKQKKGDMRTPHCTMKNPFSISQIINASTWHHDFGDGRGSIKSYGDYFLRLVTPGHSGIGIHGSTNNRESVPGRASEGCIRLRDEDIIDLKENYAFVGMKVVIKAEDVDDLPFEIHAMEKQGIERKRHFDSKKTLSNEQIKEAKATTIGEKKGSKTVASSDDTGKSAAKNDIADCGETKEENMTLEEFVKSRK